MTAIIEGPHIEETGDDWHSRSGCYFRYLTLTEKPASYPPLWVQELVYLPGVQTVTGYIDRQNSSESIRQANKFSIRKNVENKLDNIGIIKRVKNKILNSFGRRSVREINQENSFNTGVYIEICADSKENLDKLTDNVIETADDMGIVLEPIQQKHTQAIKCCVPTGPNPLNICQRMDDKAAGTILGSIF